MALYPKLDPQRVRGRWLNFREERWYCPQCEKEWIYETAMRVFFEVPPTSQFTFDPGSSLLVPNPASPLFQETKQLSEREV